jgi:processive 1,2-diacylglycerol beta-glucosyltransferase
MKNRLLVLSAAIGVGHLKAGEALCEVYIEKFNGEACHIDFLRYTSPTFGRWIEQAYYAATKHTPSVYKLLYNLAERRSPVRKSEVYIGLSKYRELIEEFCPDAIIATHFFPACVASYMYPQIPIPNATVLTDYVSHHFWVNSNTSMFFVAHDGMVAELKQFGVGDYRIKETGIPIRPCFTQKLNQRAIRAKLELDPELPLLLIMSGGNAIGPMVEVLITLSRLTEHFQVVVIAGHNQKLYVELQQTLSSVGLRGRIIGFVDNIYEYMAAADLLVSKPGGLTVAEALAQELPILIIRPTPGQEDGNTEFLTGSGAAIYIKNIADLETVMAELLQNPAKIEVMKRNAKKIAKPLATDSILMEMERLIAEKRSHARRTGLKVK